VIRIIHLHTYVAAERTNGCTRSKFGVVGQFEVSVPKLPS
jgi:hypothetical protein